MAFLISDYLLWGLSFLVAIVIIRHARTKPGKYFWSLISSQPAALASLVILTFFIGIALLDSWHIQPSSQHFSSSNTVSLLDKLLPKSTKTMERTYSAPMATHSYQPEFTRDKHGYMHSAYTPLKSTQGHHDSALSLLWHGALCGLSITLGLICLQLICVYFKQGYHALSWIRSKRSQLFCLWSCIGTLLIAGASVYHAGSVYHVFGTNQVGQDVLTQSLKSIRTGIIIGTLSSLSMIPLAIFFGLLAGYYSGWVDDVIQYVYTTLSAIPGVLLISATILVLQIQLEQHPQWFHNLAERADLHLIGLCLILGLTSWANLCRIIRAETLKIKSLDYIAAAKVLNIPSWRILAKHILPNCMHLILITIALDFSALVLAEAVLSYVGVGVDPSTPSWGNMINSARLELARDPIVWWPLAAAMILMFLLVLSANVFSDALRDALDPRMRSSSQGGDA